MPVRVVTFQSQPGKLQDIIDLYNRWVVPMLKAQKGFQRAYLVTDAASNKGRSINFWETEANLMATETSEVYHYENAMTGGYLVGEINSEHFELSGEASA